MIEKIKDVRGEVYSELTITGLLPSKKRGNSYYKQVVCKCSCGIEKTIDYKTLKKGKIKSCGCKNKKLEVVPGSVYNYWTILYEDKPCVYKIGDINRRVKVRCVCEKEKSIVFSCILTGKSKSCGCKVIRDSLKGKRVTLHSEILPLDIEKSNRRDMGHWKIIREVSRTRKEDLSIQRIVELECKCGYKKTCIYRQSIFRERIKIIAVLKVSDIQLTH